MSGIYEYDFEIFVASILANPIRIQDLKIWKMAIYTLFGHALCIFGHGNFLDTGFRRFSLHVNLTFS